MTVFICTVSQLIMSRRCTADDNLSLAETPITTASAGTGDADSAVSWWVDASDKTGKSLFSLRRPMPEPEGDDL